MPENRFPSALKRTAAAGTLLLAAASAAVITTTTDRDADQGPRTVDDVPCMRYLQPEHIYRAGGDTFATDPQGRPADALSKALRSTRGARTGCEGTVGNWAGSGDWNGGHLIAASFGGVGQRYNLVPMNGRQINQGLMKRIEDSARACLESHGSVSAYRVRLHYPDARSIIPDTITMTMTSSLSGTSRRLSFTLPNKAIPKDEVESRESAIDKEFEAAGCREVSAGRR
ncbi:DNA/RNA non-specific endonuclease [Nonomuraea sp. NPDC050783]|uniref:DNA/RNA non-specific endonuclease n=1 Tax=Nonomuraea sp. NPDC050783 TaxID=3154634 RepID=UPI0034671BE5